jgi:hypothetical protein
LLALNMACTVRLDRRGSVNGATRQAARALGMTDEIGTIEVETRGFGPVAHRAARGTLLRPGREPVRRCRVRRDTEAPASFALGLNPTWPASGCLTGAAHSPSRASRLPRELQSGSRTSTAS